MPTRDSENSGSSIFSRGWAIVFFLWGSAAAQTVVPLDHTSQVRYGRDIRPLLSDRCFKCHGPDANSREADLRLDQAEDAYADRGGYAAIVPGDPEHSEILRRVASADPDEQMPPPDSKKHRLSPEEQDRLRQWIAAGAPYEPHWSFVPPRRPDLPIVKEDSKCFNEVDLFIQARLAQDHLRPARMADRASLCRRLFLDLTGLPPTPEELTQFLRNPTEAEYRRWVDRLLTEEPYRSRMAEHFTSAWLDAARYADTNGIHMDAGRQMWLWRDWVLRAFRDNMPFNQFLTDQLAGDLIPNATLDQQIASGFNRNHVITDEGGAIPEEYLVEYAVDRTATTSAVFLALTMGCARCHEHKFDPISQEEFYGLYAFFNSIEEPGLYTQSDNPQRAFEPYISVPSAAQREKQRELETRRTEIRADLEKVEPEELTQQQAFFQSWGSAGGTRWQLPIVVAAQSDQGSQLTTQEDGSVLVSGPNPDRDVYSITMRSPESWLNLLAIEVLTDPSLPEGRVGRAPNGNAVLTGVRATVRSVEGPPRSQPISFVWVWADYEQSPGDFLATNVLDTRPDTGWAVGAHLQPGNRVLLLMAEQPFGYDSGTELHLTLEFESVYSQHTFGRFRTWLGVTPETSRSALSLAASRWYRIGPFGAVGSPYAFSLELETGSDLDFDREYGSEGLRWQATENLDGQPITLDSSGQVTYLARRVYSPHSRVMQLSLGSDDGFELFVNGRSVSRREIDRAVAPDQEQVQVQLRPGHNLLLLKVVNTGGDAGYYFREASPPPELADGLVAAILPEQARGPDLQRKTIDAWRARHLPRIHVGMQRIQEVEKQLADLERQIPVTMVMKELPEPRETFLLKRGVYDAPDRSKVIPRGVPTILGPWPEGSPKNRLGLAQWMLSEQQPLVSRVVVNRLWERFFGQGLVRTSDNFGLQGEWPSHPELLDWLAIELREKNWDLQHIIRLITTSYTYRQSSDIRPEVAARDPDNRLLAAYPRRRLTAEQLRDLALYVSGLLHEQLGGPSVKPYQPEGLWEEIAMTQSNTRVYQMGSGPDLWRRSLYTYWKRACPPPSLLTLDAPTREFCTIRRSITNTPLQALVLWNDPQFVEAARVLAQRTLKHEGTETDRIISLFVRCTARHPEPEEVLRMQRSLRTFESHYRKAVHDAQSLLRVGQAQLPRDLDPAQLAAWTLLANATLNLAETITQD